MGKCLKTTLNGVVSDTSILKLGEIRMTVKKVDAPSANINRINVKYDTDASISIIGEGNFTNESMNENKGKTATLTPNEDNRLVYSNSDVEFSIPNKYDLVKIESFNPSTSFDIESFKYSKKVKEMYFYGTNIYGNLSSIKDLSLKSFVVTGSKVTGNLSNLKNMTEMSNLHLAFTSITGNLSDIKNMRNLTQFDISKTNINGDLSDLKDLTKLSGSIEIGETQDIRGDLALLPNNILLILNRNKNTTFTWTSTSRTNALALIDVRCDNIDKLLNDMSALEAKFMGEEEWYKKISLIGTRTSASDAAIQTLQSKGYTVSITPA